LTTFLKCSPQSLSILGNLGTNISFTVFSKFAAGLENTETWFFYSKLDEEIWIQLPDGYSEYCVSQIKKAQSQFILSISKIILLNSLCNLTLVEDLREIK
jgi:hypothetical protein